MTVLGPGTPMRFDRVLLAILVAASLFATPSSGDAQTVLARVLDGEDSRPVFGALAYLLDSEGTVLKRALTDQLGRALFVGLQAGAFRVRVEMIGKATVETDLFQVAPGVTATQDVRLESSAIILEGLQVEAEGGRCRVRPAQGLGVAELWDEARKALSAAAFTNREAVYLYRTTLYTRDLALDAKTIQREEQMTGSKLFDSKPAEDLIENGFVQSDGDGQLYFAPDADVLLSDPFLDSHCFRFTVGRGEAEGMVGLGFEPASRRNRNIDISGTLWLDGQTFELRWLQYNYENLDPDINSSEVGGHVEFQRLPNGTWIVPEWWIQMPRIGTFYDTSGRARTRITAYRRTGGRVLQVREAGAAGRTVVEAETGAIEGVVFDSLGIEPLVGARVGMVGSNQTVFTDANGQFVIQGLTGGRYQISISHPSVEEIGFRPPPIIEEVVEGQVTAVQFRMPAKSDVVFEACRGESQEDGSGAVLGQVVDQRGRALPGATVSLTWERFVSVLGGLPQQADVLGLQATADADGYYRICGVPEGQLLTIRGGYEGVETAGDTIRVREEGGARVHRVEIRSNG